MPQMMPMNWFILYLIIWALLVMMMSKLYYLSLSTFNSKLEAQKSDNVFDLKL